MKEITVVEHDRVGLLADISEALGEKRINIDSLAVEVVGRTCIARLLVENAEAAKKALEARKFRVIAADILVLHLKDQPGELAKVTRLLADHGVAVSNVYMVNRENNMTVLALSVSDYEKAKKALKV